jgi:hypothetical protein
MGEDPDVSPGLDSLPRALRLAHLIRTGEIGKDQAAGWIEKGKVSENPFVAGLFADW